MKYNKNYCENLYKEYKELDAEIGPIIQDYVPGKKLIIKDISSEDLEKLGKIKKELTTKCRSYLESEKLFEIENG